MKTEYAKLMDAAYARSGCQPVPGSHEDSAMAYFKGCWLHQDAYECVVDDLAKSKALRAALLTRYPALDIDWSGTRIALDLMEPLAMALLVDFVLCHDDLYPDTASLNVLYGAIADEVDAVLARTPDMPEHPGCIDMGADSYIDRAGLAAGLAWLRAHIAAGEAAG